MGYSLVEAKIRPGDHLCSFYENKEEQFQVVVPFIVDGLVKNEKCLYIADENTVSEIKSGLIIHGIDVDERIRTGQLKIITAKQSYLKSSRFVLDEMISLLESFLDDAQKEGYAASRVAGELTWLLRDLDSLDEFFEYENRLNGFFKDKPVKLLCQYDSSKFFGNVIVRALKTHPRVLVGLDLYENTYYKHQQLASHIESQKT
ncbi:MEDS domain-containing protein [Candidatus Bathyarchaeota archaeon]|nr:MEDS domain-containing protein [Candidatus Bathyarchaeota archaeon]